MVFQPFCMAFLVIMMNRVWFLHNCLVLGVFFFEEVTFLSLSIRLTIKALHKYMFRAAVPAATVMNRVLNFCSGRENNRFWP